MPPKEPEIFKGVLVVMKMDYEKFQNLKESIYDFARQNGIQMDIA
jgi:hypothetical protein